jgi:hypothetical protein
MSQPQASTPAAIPTPTPASSPLPAAAPFQIVGDKTNGYVIFDPSAGIVRKFDFKNNMLGDPSPVPKLTQAPSAASANQAPANEKNGAAGASRQGAATAGTPAPAALAQGIAGNATTGVVYFIGNQMAYLADVGNPMAAWKTLRELPFGPGSGIKGVSGDVVNGVVVHNGELLAQAPDLFAYPTWQSNAISPRLPILSIAGDCVNGIVLVCDASAPQTDYEDENKFLPSVYRFSGKQPYGPAAPVLPDPKIKIEMLFGDGANGFMAFGEHQVYQLDPTKGWGKQISLPFGFNAVAGNPKDGLVALIGTENFIVNSSTDFQTWTLKRPATPPTAPAPAGGSASSTSPLPTSNSAGTATQGNVLTNGASDAANAAASASAMQSAPASIQA